MEGRHVKAIPVGLLLVWGVGCVTTGTYNAKVAELQQATADHDKAAADREKGLQEQISALEAKEKDTEDRLAKAQGEAAFLRKELDDTTALAGELKKRLEKLGQNVEKLTSEKGQLAQGLADAKDRLEELRKQKAAAEARAATFRQLVEKLHAMIDAGKLKVVIREGRMLIALPNDVLFDSGKTSLKPEGQAALGQVAQVLASLSDRRFVVAGHTDNVPIHTQRFPSNWELSTERAVEVVNLLIAKGMKPELLAAAGHAEFDPVASNDTPEGRAQNRRIEIVLQANISELPSFDDAQTTSTTK
jgi:chemotaxis protein MotB